ncbi:small ribosomal subunit protein uS15-like, partial [Musa acuminata AAA Group]|uniref:small ribosomal subunit protein uS15-like n=1 Tax=Musa acuminata AAA Group TaxID=214697 RepID=UPI0031DDE672
NNTRCHSLYRSQSPKRPPHRRCRGLCRFSYILRPVTSGRRRHGSHAQPRKGKPPSWLKISAQDVEESICKFAKKGLMPSQIGATLRDSHGIAQVKSVTGSKILRILKAHGFAPDTPEDLYRLI